MTLRVIGDIHGNFEKYAEITDGCNYSVQLGDFGFRYSGEHLCGRVDPYHHRFFGGNHDNYDIYAQTPRSLGDFGVVCMGGIEFFYIRGAFSIDYKYRQAVKNGSGFRTWWPEEQLTEEKMAECFDLYRTVRPDIVITHTCPKVIADEIGEAGALQSFGFDPETFTTRTQEFLEKCFAEHQPRDWVFGHFHKTWGTVYAGTDFTCINTCKWMDLL